MDENLTGRAGEFSLAGFIRILRWNYCTDSFAGRLFLKSRIPLLPKLDTLGGKQQRGVDGWQRRGTEYGIVSQSAREMIMDLCRNWFYYK